ncbi:MAG: hypothetical protein GC164_06745 [Phycisphaera sp.]|nr:hypothetical protein [Phycisphaera sp.]
MADVAGAPASSGIVEVDPELPDDQPVEGVSGSIKRVGSDTMNNLMTLWGEGFRKFYPNVKIEIEGKGSSTAPPALIEGTATFGPMSREMKNKEVDAFEAKFGYKPTVLPVSIDMLAVYVHKDTVKEQPGSSSVVQGVAKDLYGIGYSTADLAAVALSFKPSPPQAPDPGPPGIKFPISSPLLNSRLTFEVYSLVC